MITNITLENFKCFHKVEINPKLVTLFIGPNGTGKSGVLQALLLLKQSKDAGQRLDLRGRLINLPEDDFLFHGVHGESGRAGLTLSGYYALPTLELDTPVAFDLGIAYSRRAEVVEVTQNKAIATYMGRRVETQATDWAVQEQEQDDPADVDGEPSHLAHFRAFVEEQLQERFERAHEEMRQGVPTLLRRLRAVPAARGFAQPEHTLVDAPPSEVSLALGLGQQEDQIISSLVYSQSAVNRLSIWMNRVTGVGFITDIQPNRTIRPASNTKAGSVSLLAEGFGTNALVLLLFELAKAERESTLLIEEPEIHLHPKAQAELASVIVEEAKASNKQVIMTTHSEHIAGRLLTLVAEGAISPEEVAIYSFEKDDETGVCSASEIEVTPRGQVMGGLRSFFETDLDEMSRYSDALRKQA